MFVCGLRPARWRSDSRPAAAENPRPLRICGANTCVRRWGSTRASRPALRGTIPATTKISSRHPAGCASPPRAMRSKIRPRRPMSCGPRPTSCRAPHSSNTTAGPSNPIRAITGTSSCATAKAVRWCLPSTASRRPRPRARVGRPAGSPTGRTRSSLRPPCCANRSRSKRDCARRGSTPVPPLTANGPLTAKPLRPTGSIRVTRITTNAISMRSAT